MKSLELAGYYFSWHYKKAPGELLRVWGNFLWFVYHFFSIGLLTKTLFSPFRRIREKRKKGLDIEEFASVLIINLLMRLIGFIMRAILILAGLLAELVMLILGLAVFLIWLFMPAIILMLLIAGINLFL